MNGLSLLCLTEICVDPRRCGAEREKRKPIFAERLGSPPERHLDRVSMLQKSTRLRRSLQSAPN